MEYDGRPSSDTSFVTCGIASASSSRSTIVTTAALCHEFGKIHL